MKTMLVFPGQGSQYAGMGQDVYNKYQSAQKFFDENKHFRDIIFDGNEEELKKTNNTQPALMMVSYAVWLAFNEEYGKNAEIGEGEKIKQLNISAVAGHSLGEYSALSVAGGCDANDCVEILSKRGQAMMDNCPEGTGMLAVLGSNKETIEGIIAEIQPKTLVIANSNCIGQIVVSGYNEDIDKFIETGKQKGLKKMIKLPVSGAFHSPLMQNAKEEFENFVDGFNVKTPKYEILQNFSGKFEKEPETIKNNLKQQITAPILWTENIQMAIQNGFDTFIEIGAKNVLFNLIKRINDNVKILHLEKVEEIQTFFDTLNN